MQTLKWQLIFFFIFFGDNTYANDSIFKQVGEYKIFFSAFNSSFIPPDIASSYKIVRGKDRGLVNVSIMKDVAVGVPVQIKGEVSNILQQSQKLKFFPVQEGKSLYYLAPFEFDNEDYLTFSINIEHENKIEIPNYTFKFQKKLYTD